MESWKTSIEIVISRWTQPSKLILVLGGAVLILCYMKDSLGSHSHFL